MKPEPDHSNASGRIPAAAAWLGGLGLIPFVAMTLVLVAGGPALPFAPGLALIGYGAVILSFLGGIHWGVALRPTVDLHNDSSPIAVSLVFGVIPSIIGWIALLLPLATATALLCAGFALQLWLDLRTIAQGRLPAWFARLRIILTVIVMLSLIAAGLS
jgi:hypothetical protein